MKKPNNYENTPVQGEYTPVELGGHKMVIMSVEEKMSKTNKPMIVVYFDFAKGDQQAGYFMEAFKNDTFLTCVEHSNSGFETQWVDDFGKQFKGKLIGGVFGQQKDYYNGRELDKRILRWFVSMDKVDEADIPDEMETQAYKNHAGGYPAGSTPAGDGFMNIPDGIDEELPFN